MSFFLPQQMHLDFPILRDGENPQHSVTNRLDRYTNKQDIVRIQIRGASATLKATSFSPPQATKGTCRRSSLGSSPSPHSQTRGPRPVRLGLPPEGTPSTRKGIPPKERAPWDRVLCSALSRCALAQPPSGAGAECFVPLPAPWGSSLSARLPRGHSLALQSRGGVSCLDEFAGDPARLLLFIQCVVGLPISSRKP